MSRLPIYYIYERVSDTKRWVKRTECHTPNVQHPKNICFSLHVTAKNRDISIERAEAAVVQVPKGAQRPLYLILLYQYHIVGCEFCYRRCIGGLEAISGLQYLCFNTFPMLGYIFLTTKVTL